MSRSGGEPIAGANVCETLVQEENVLGEAMKFAPIRLLPLPCYECEPAWDDGCAPMNSVT